MTTKDAQYYAKQGTPPLESFVWASFHSGRSATDEVCVACQMLPVSCRQARLFRAAETVAKATLQIMEAQGKLSITSDGWYIKTESSKKQHPIGTAEIVPSSYKPSIPLVIKKKP